MIWKSVMPWCFSEMELSSFPVMYQSNKHTWMACTLWKEWVEHINSFPQYNLVAGQSTQQNIWDLFYVIRYIISVLCCKYITYKSMQINQFLNITILLDIQMGRTTIEYVCGNGLPCCNRALVMSGHFGLDVCMYCCINNSKILCLAQKRRSNIAFH